MWTMRGRIPMPAVWSSTQGSYPASHTAICIPPPPQVRICQACCPRWPPKLRRMRLHTALHGLRTPLKFFYEVEHRFLVDMFPFNTIN
jgi:hypothetical protein